VFGAPVGEYLGVATNQQAEIVAAAVGLESLQEPCKVNLFTDSRYVVETMCGRFRKKTNQFGGIAWIELLKDMRLIGSGTRGHAGHTLQEAADATARRIAAAQRVDESILRDAD
jgi:ribonuclease HI